MAQYYDRISPCCIRYFSFYSYLPLSISRKEGLPYIGSLDSLWHHQGSSWSRKQLLAVHLDFINSKFHSTNNSNKKKIVTTVFFLCSFFSFL
ncbi:unnamed protein product [Rotaria socialis]